jgi:carbamoyltransferase
VIALGLNGFAGADHDASAAVVIDGLLVAAVEEERLNHRRHAPGDRPVLAVPEALRIAGIEPADVDVVCHGWRPEALGLGLDEASEGEAIRQALVEFGVSLRRDTQVRFVDHHLAHFWSAVPFLPPDADRRAIDGLIVDGAGESTSGALYRLRGGDPQKIWNLGIAGSLGLLYEAATAAIGFAPGNEGKTMGLASYGRPQTMDSVPAPADDRFAGPIPRLADRGEIKRQHRSLVLRMKAMAGQAASFNRRADLALGMQSAVQERIMSFLAEIADPAATLIMAGGVALNCSINATVADWCLRRGATLTIPPPANDGGISIGAAVSVSDSPEWCRAETAFLGRGYEPGEIITRLAALGASATEMSAGELCDGLLERDLVCGWFEGRAEVGPRALGKRAVLARADSVRVRDRLNVIKGRESWRPLAPSVLPGEFRSSFTGVPSAYMLINCEATASALRPLAGVIHVDSTARPQVVDHDLAAGPYADVLNEMKKRTGHAAITCTSFNVGGQPIVYTPEDAYAAAMAMGLDLLAGDGWCVRVPRAASGRP